MGYFDGKVCELCGAPAAEHSSGSMACALKLRDQRDEARAVALEEREQKHWPYLSAKNTAIMEGWAKPHRGEQT